MSDRPRRVVKVGGSLLTWDRLEPVLRNWLAQQPPAVTILVPGGGAAADAVRDACKRQGLDDEQAHWLAVEAMSLSARRLRALLPEAALATSLAELRAAQASTLLLVDPLALLRHEPNELGPARLPHTWAATSDSIAARIAEAVGADELVLLKSCPPPPHASWEEAAEAGFVDAYFPQAIARLPRVRAENMSKANDAVVSQPTHRTHHAPS